MSIQEFDAWLEIGTRLRTARETAHYTQGAVGGWLNIPRTSVSAMECGKRKVYALELKALCRLYGVTLEYVLGEPDQPSPTVDGRCNGFCVRVLCELDRTR